MRAVLSPGTRPQSVSISSWSQPPTLNSFNDKIKRILSNSSSTGVQALEMKASIDFKFITSNTTISLPGNHHAIITANATIGNVAAGKALVIECATPLVKIKRGSQADDGAGRDGRLAALFMGSSVGWIGNVPVPVGSSGGSLLCERRLGGFHVQHRDYCFVLRFSRRFVERRSIQGLQFSHPETSSEFCDKVFSFIHIAQRF